MRWITEAKIWCECPFADANALRTVPGGKGSWGYLFVLQTLGDAIDATTSVI